MTPDWARIRANYPALTGRTYLNTATYGMCSQRTASAAAEHFARRDRYACADFLDWFDDLDATRTKVARLIHCQPRDVAFAPNASTPLSLFLGGIDWKPGDRVVTLTDEFPNQIYFAALLQESGVEFVETAWSDFYRAVNDRTRAVLLSQVGYITGFRAPLEQIGPWLREKDILLYVDATQALGALQCDVSRVQPAMLAAHAYKWLLSPNGAGFFYVSPALRQSLKPNVVGWRSHRDWRNVDQLHAAAPIFADAAEKYEGGMPCFPSLYAMDAALEELLDIGPEHAERRVLELTALLQRRLRDLGGVDILHENSPITAARIQGADAAALAQSLKAQGILASARARLSAPLGALL